MIRSRRVTGDSPHILRSPSSHIFSPQFRNVHHTVPSSADGRFIDVREDVRKKRPIGTTDPGSTTHMALEKTQTPS